MTARQVRWTIAGMSIVAEILSFAAWREWVARELIAKTEPA
jgi:hypothetical protein